MTRLHLLLNYLWFLFELMDSTTLVKVFYNWNRVGGRDFPEILQIKNADPDVFLKSPLEEIVSADKAILLDKGDKGECLEIVIDVFPEYKIQAFSFVSNVNKVEIFQGKLKEYLKTEFGLPEEDDVYRYDLELEKSGVTDVAIKFLSAIDEICIYGIQIHIAPNPNGITTLVSSNINFDNVQSILKSTKPLTPASEKCAQLLEIMGRTKALKESRDMSSGSTNLTNIDIARSLSSLEENIDHKMNTFEGRVTERLNAIEERQNDILNCLAKIVEKLDCR
ncbi:uncharacterized protein LOC142227553 [Haematobia irritans]|uniref:uncharacterized protein LOC142227553 n=1 Tax=Haematobia irritans TaxID=7368 RepID=UPI003F50A810